MRRPSAFSVSATVAVLLTGAIFGFFYAWVCSTMWGLDDADPRVAIAAMQAMNASVRNAVFFPAFFLTPVALAGGCRRGRAGLGGLLRPVAGVERRAHGRQWRGPAYGCGRGSQCRSAAIRVDLRCG